ncbi:MAG: hypothetical protein MZV63_14365 [Marinilabiliales bacterium]|nr:hypothetical protein [Marinilabiliales bacterium]
MTAKRRAQRRRAEQVVAAAVARGAGLEDCLRGLGLLREARQGVVLAEDADDRPALAVAGHERGRHPGQSALDLEALLLGVGGERFRRADSRAGRFRRSPRPGRSAR